MERAENERDSLVINGPLEPPLSNSNEYKLFLKKQIRRWDGENFVLKYPDL